MPIYEYGCKSCGHKLDALQKMNDAPLVDCPECGKPELKRLISAPRFRLKGSGWYETDFKKDNQRNIAKADSESGTSSSDKGEKADKADKTDKSGTSETAAKSKADVSKPAARPDSAAPSSGGD